MTKSELTDAVMVKTKMPRAAAEKAVSAFTAAITEELAGNGQVALPGFGTFAVKDRPARKVHNLHTGEMMDIPASKVPTFRPGKALKDAVKTAG